MKRFTLGLWLASCLAELFNGQLFPATPRQLEISQEEVGRLCGLVRQSAHSALHDLEHAGVVRLGYQTIEVVDLPGLQKLARGG